MNTYALIVILHGISLLNGPSSSFVTYVESKAVCDAGLNVISTELTKNKTPYKAFCIPTTENSKK